MEKPSYHEDQAFRNLRPCRVTAVGPGTAVITITTKDGGFKATVTVTAKATPVAVTGVKLDKHELTLAKGEKATLVATVEPEGASDKSLTWKSSDPASVAVDGGELLAGTAGTAVITVITNDGEVKDERKVTVTDSGTPGVGTEVTGITLSSSDITLKVGDSQALTATVEPEGATDKSLEWKSDKSSVAIVDDEGKVTAVGVGTAHIIVTSKSNPKVSTSCYVTVTAASYEFRTQYLDDNASIAPFGNVIHYKDGTNYSGTSNEFYVLVWDTAKNEVVKDNTAEHFTVSEKWDWPFTVEPASLGSYYGFKVTLETVPANTIDYDDFTFNYDDGKGTKISKTTRVVAAHSSATSAFSYAVRGVDDMYVYKMTDAFTYTKPNAGDNAYLRLMIAFDSPVKMHNNHNKL